METEFVFGTVSSLVDLVKYKEWACVGTFKCIQCSDLLPVI